MTPLFPDIAEQLREAADRLEPAPAPADRPPPPHRAPAARGSRNRLMVLAGGTAALATLAVLVAGVLPSGTPTPGSLLTPRDAVAGALTSLSSNGILEWTDRQTPQSSSARPAPARVPSTTIHRWIDLTNADSSIATDDTFFRAGGERHQATATTWNVGRTSWLQEGQVSKTTGKLVVRKTITAGAPSPQAAQWTPLARLRRTLQRAHAGKLPIRNAAAIRGIPVVEITDRREGFTQRTWVTKERSPRILRSAFTVDCSKVLDCSNISDDGTPHGGSTTLSETLTWTIHPRIDAAALAHVQAPVFDPAKYEVITTRRSR